MSHNGLNGPGHRSIKGLQLLQQGNGQALLVNSMT
jgi:hypothetical protein